VCVVVVVVVDERLALQTTERVPLIEALSGAVLRVHTLDGRELLVRVPAGRVLKPGETVVVRNEGMVRSTRLARSLSFALASARRCSPHTCTRARSPR
jgi:urease accessory protein UreE